MNRARVESLWLKQPELTIEQVRRRTGAPSSCVRFVYRQLLAAGKLALRKNRGRNFDALRAV